MIVGKHIHYKYKTKVGNLSVLNGLSFEISQGRITAFIGQSGAGKTTLLKCIGNLLNGYEGAITLQGVDLKALNPAERALNIGFVSQHFNLFPHFTVLQNCLHPLTKVLHLSAKEAAERSVEMLQMLSIDAYAGKHPQHLSGGQQQRAAIARALVMKPKVLLLDEPTSALDPESKKGLESIILKLVKNGISIALSSHDMPFIRKIMDQVYFLENGSISEQYDSAYDMLSSKAKINQFLRSDL